MIIGKVLELCIDSILVSGYFLYCGKSTFRYKIEKRVKNILIIELLLIFSAMNYLFFDNVIRLLNLYVAVLFVYKFLYGKSTSQCAALALVSYFLIFVGEISFTIILILFNKIGLITDMTKFTGSVVANSIVCLVAAMCFIILKNQITKAITKIKENNKVSLIFTFVVVLLAISSIFYKMSFDGWKLNSELILNILFIISLIVVGLSIVKQHLDKNKISEEYEKYVEYSKQSEKLVEEYSISQHENKNELIIIRSMVHKSNKKLLEYLDEIIKSKDKIENAWIRNLRYIPFGGLKGIIHNKVSEMKELGIKVFMDISREVGKSRLKELTISENNQLSKIIGVFLDNAKEATLVSEEKEVSIIVYKEKEKIVFEISNTYVEEVDIKKIYHSGYTSKGKNRGYGLALVRTIVDENSIFENDTRIIDDYFVQTLKVNITK